MKGAAAVGLGVSSAGVDWAAEKLAPYARSDLPLVMITKGLSASNGELGILPDRLRLGLQKEIHPAAIAGPCIAGELAKRVETCVVLTSRDPRQITHWQELLKAPYYHVVPRHDTDGVEICAALKNAYAMGIAFATGQHEATSEQGGSIAFHNTESAVFAQAIFEMNLLLEVLGGQPKTAAGLAGVGDLDVTTNGGRTGRFGKFLGRGLSVQQAIDKMAGATLECLEILEVLRAALARPSLGSRFTEKDLPLLRHMIAVALEGEPVALPLSKFFGAEN